MVQTQSLKPRQRQFRARAWVILATVGLAVTIPILPLGFLGIPGPDFLGDVRQVVETSKSWFSGLGSNTLTANKSQTGDTASDKARQPGIAPATRVKVLERAAGALTRELDRNPQDPSLHNRLGIIFLSLGEVDDANQHFTRAVELSKRQLNLLSNQLASCKGGADEATTFLVEASKVNIELLAAHSNLARLYERMGRHDKVLIELEAMNAESVLPLATPETADVSDPGQRLSPQVASQVARAESLLQSHAVGPAGDEYRRIIAAHPTLAIAHERLGFIAALSGNTVGALDELEAAARLNPRSSQIRNELGAAYNSLGFVDKAEEAFRQALEVDSGCVDAALNLSNIYATRGELDLAANVLNLTNRANARSAKLHNNLATIYAMKGEATRARFEFQKALSLDPTMASAYYGLGVSLADSGSYVEAIHQYKQALYYNPHLFGVQAKIDQAYRKAGIATGHTQIVN